MSHKNVRLLFWGLLLIAVLSLGAENWPVCAWSNGGSAPDAVLIGITQRVSVSSSGEQGNGNSAKDRISVSANGRCVAFTSEASNLVDVDTNGYDDIFVRDRLTNQTERISISSSEEQANDHSHHPTISADCRFVAF
jgi:hypothetical protein